MRPHAGLALIACLSLAGCADLSLLKVLQSKPPTPPAKAKKLKPKRPLDAKSYYLRMAEIDHSTTVLVASERRRLRRLKGNPSFAVQKQGVLGSFDSMESVLRDMDRDLKALGKPPAVVQPLHTLWLDELRRDRATYRRLVASLEGSSPSSANRAFRAVGRADERRHRRMERREAALRRRLGLKAKPGKAYVAPEPPRPDWRTVAFRRPVAPSTRVEPFNRVTVVDRHAAQDDRAFVEFVVRVHTFITRHNQNMEEWGRETRASVPPYEDEIGPFIREKLREALAKDREALDVLSGLGTPPKEIRDYMERNRRRVGISAYTLSSILASGDDARGMIRQLDEVLADGEWERARRDNIAAFAPARRRLREISRRGTVPSSVWAKLKG